MFIFTCIAEYIRGYECINYVQEKLVLNILSCCPYFTPVPPQVPQSSSTILFAV